ncbi:hypothetical protein UNDYM_4324 [Undibacterium sp. YM2]|uniref:hypothetical protein n=1 Tax=Undibacterium sp. YM2 TaxID=2058625 RepID=UPI001331EE47|nr:hypothetical protein [Undibacterium sp. YM2]BBB68577.1 hypothetical protein UNDYM_4324 [Undibacterium sp. YM2]
MKSSILCISTALLLASGSSLAQDTAGDIHQLASLFMVKLLYTTADELETHCTQIDPAYQTRFAEKRIAWDKDIKMMYAMSSTTSKFMGMAKKHSANTATNPLNYAEQMTDMSKQRADSARPAYEIPAKWKELKLNKNIKEDVENHFAGLDEAGQKKRCEYILTKKGMPALPPKELP